MFTLKKGGILVSVAQPIDQDKLSELGIRGEFVFIGANAKILAQLAELVDAGIIRPVVGKEFSLKDIKEAHKLSATGHARGKIVISVGTP